MSSKCGRRSSFVLAVLSTMSRPLVLHVLLLLQSELVDVAVSGPKSLRAAREVAHVAVVNLFGLKCDRFVLVRLQRFRPGVQRPHIMRLQRLDPGDIETRVR